LLTLIVMWVLDGTIVSMTLLEHTKRLNEHVLAAWSHTAQRHALSRMHALAQPAMPKIFLQQHGKSDAARAARPQQQGSIQLRTA